MLSIRKARTQRSGNLVTSCTAQIATSAIAMPCPVRFHSIRHLARVRLAEALVASLGLILAWSFQTRIRRSRAVRSNLGRHRAIKNVRSKWKSTPSVPMFRSIRHGNISPQNIKSGSCMATHFGKAAIKPGKRNGMACSVFLTGSKPSRTKCMCGSCCLNTVVIRPARPAKAHDSNPMPSCGEFRASRFKT